MKAKKIEIIMLEDNDAEYFITMVLPKLREQYKFKQIFFTDCEYFEK